MTQPYFLTQPSNRVPVLVSVPHCGVEFPPDIARTLNPHLVKRPEDTDWFVHELYDFAQELGITLVHARYSRYVVDLNRHPAGQPLYTDGRTETNVVPTQSFAGEVLYPGKLPDDTERCRRLALYFEPYHLCLRQTLDDLQREFGAVLLYDAHSIRRLVPAIRPEPFPDLILGDQRGHSADARLSVRALERLREGGGYGVAHNEPFQGGYITRHFGQPSLGVHALQLEMAQDLYLDTTGAKDAKKAEALSLRLRRTLQGLIVLIGELGREIKG